MANEKNTTTMAFRYRILRVTSDEQRVRTEIRQAHNLYNDLVAIERKRRDKVRWFWAEQGGYTDKLTALSASIEEASRRVKLTARGDDGKRERREIWASVDELRHEVWELQRKAEDELSDPAKIRRKERAKVLKAEAKERTGKVPSKTELATLLDAEPVCLSARDRRRIDLVKEYEARGIGVSAKTIAQRLRDEGLVGPAEHIEAVARADAYGAYIARGVSPGTRGIVTEAFKRSLEDVSWDEQRFSRWDGHGAFGVQLQGGATSDAIHSGTHTQVQLHRLDDTGKHRAGSRRSGRLHKLRVRIASEARLPVWATFDAIVDRPLPPEAKATRVVVTCDRAGLENVYHVVFTCTVPKGIYHRRSVTQQGTVALDFGWRSRGKGAIRVAYWVDDRGEHGEICLPHVRVARRGSTGKRGYEQKLQGRQSILSIAKHARDLQEIMTREFAEFAENKLIGGALFELADWLSKNAGILPEWLTEKTVGVHAWRSQPRLYWLVQEWKGKRFAGDEEAFALLDAWATDWAHLENWEKRESASIGAARDEHFRLMALSFAKKYERLVINGADLSAVRVRKAKGETDRLVMVDDRSRSQAQLAAPGRLREEVVRCAKKWQAVLIKAPPDKVTCWACGRACTYDAAAFVEHVCEHCGHQWDQDENCCRNMLREWSGGATTVRPARERERPAKSVDLPKPKRRRGPVGEAAE